MVHTASGVAFVDANENGKYDQGESPLSDVRLVAEFNVHGGIYFAETTTDAMGEATLQAAYTHYFDIQAAVPCGYWPTTDSIHRVERDGESFDFGFAPGANLAQPATVSLFVWLDDDRDGQQGSAEAPLAGADLACTVIPRGDRPGLPTATLVPPSHRLTFTTDAGGHATLDLGQRCGDLQLALLYRGVTTQTATFPIDLGSNELAWGVTPR